MPFQSQFSLSLELTKLIPLGLAIGKTYEAAMSLARDLRSSGSDIVVEEDLAEIFGRSRIATQMASTFRTIVSKANPPQKLCEGIALCDGPGPTVIRALTQDAYFSMVLQCSFLLSVHEKGSLAAAIAYHFEKQAQDAPEGRAIRPTPSRDGIQGFLQACEDQTSSFNWQNLLLAVGATLGTSEKDMYVRLYAPLLPGSIPRIFALGVSTKVTIEIRLETMPSVIFRGLLIMLPLVQHFPEERLIHLETDRGVCGIIVWAHHMLGLPVLVRLHHNGETVEYHFGSSEIIIIDVRSNAQASFLPSGEPTLRHSLPTITLLESSDKERLFRMVEEPDEEVIDATFKTPACRYGSKIFNAEVSLEDGREKVMTEMAHIATAFAVCISKALSISGNGVLSTASAAASSLADTLSEDVDVEDDRSVRDEACSLLPYEVSKTRIHEAASLLFDDLKLTRKKTDQYVVKFSERAVFELPIPEVISAMIQNWPERATYAPPEDASSVAEWPRLRLIAMQLSTLILAFAHVSDLHAASGLPLCQFPQLLSGTDLSKQIATWDGSKLLQIKSNVWFEVIVQLTIGHTTETSFETTSLISARGWSIFLNTFGDADPSFLDPGFFAIKKGVPCRNGVWKHRVIDGPSQVRDHLTWKLEASPGESVALSCPVNAICGIPLVGEREDSFVVSIRVQTADGCISDDSSTPNIIRRTGYNELAKALWRTQRSKSCQHHPRLGEKVVLEPGIIAVSGFGDCADIENLGGPDIVICLTACNPTARWRALLSMACQSTSEAYGYPPVMLRGRDCCFACVIQQTWQQGVAGDTWCIVL